VGMTLAEKIIARHTADKVVAGAIVKVKVDFAFANDITAPMAIEDFYKMGAKKLFDPQRVSLIPDHFVPNKDIKSAEQSKMMKEFAVQHGVEYYYEVGRGGIEHALLPEEGLVLPGEIILGADSHTCTHGAVGAFATGVGSTDLAAAWVLGETWFKVPHTIRVNFNGKLPEWVSAKDLILYLIGKIGIDGALYKALEFGGKVVEDMNMDGRFTICNMAIEAGAKTGIIPPDETTFGFLKDRAKRDYEPLFPDNDADYEQVIEIDVSNLTPQVALPHLPSNVRPVGDVGRIKIDQVVIGSCTNGRDTDMEVTHRILKGKKVAPWVRLIVVPATQRVYLNMLEKGWVKDLIEAGAVVSTPTCGPCLGGHMGVLAKGERAVSTTNRNFVGRMGHPESEVYLSSPAVAAASAITGYITDPAEVV